MVGGNDHFQQCSIACNGSLRLPRSKCLICNRDDLFVYHLRLGLGMMHQLCHSWGTKQCAQTMNSYSYIRLSGSQPSWISGRATVGVAASPLMRSFTGSKPLPRNHSLMYYLILTSRALSSEMADWRIVCSASSTQESQTKNQACVPLCLVW